MSLIRKHVAVLQAWACLALVYINVNDYKKIPTGIQRVYTFGETVVLPC